LKVDGENTRFTISPDGQRLAFVDMTRRRPDFDQGSATIRVFDTGTGREAFPAREATALVTGLAFAPAGRRLVTDLIRMDGLRPQYFLQIWDAESGRPLSPPLPHLASLSSWERSPDGTRLVTVTSLTPSVQGEARVWDVTSGTVVAGPFHHGASSTGRVLCASLSPDGRLLASANERGDRRCCLEW